MKHNIPTTIQNAQSIIQQNAANNRKENCSEYKPIEGTPFTLVKKVIDYDPLTDDEDNQYFLAMGDYRLTEPTETEKETMDKLETEFWMIVFTVVAIVNEKMSAKTIAELGQDPREMRNGQETTVTLPPVDDNVTP